MSVMRRSLRKGYEQPGLLSSIVGYAVGCAARLSRSLFVLKVLCVYAQVVWVQMLISE